MTEINFYGEEDWARGKAASARQIRSMFALGLPFIALAIAAFILRIKLLCIGAAIVGGALMIFVYDLRVSPQVWYNRYLREIQRGVTHQTAGMLKSIGQDEVFQEHVNFYEVIVNIYEDQDPDGDRRFWLDCSKALPEAWIGRDVAVTSQGVYITGMRLMGAQA